MKITRPTEVTVEFENAQEASRFLYAYHHSEAFQERLHFPLLTSRTATSAERVAAVHAAVQHLADEHALMLVQKAPEAAAPTYISGSDPSKVYDLRTMPTRYMVNVLNMAPSRQAIGLVREITAELRRRGETAKTWA